MKIKDTKQLRIIPEPVSIENKPGIFTFSDEINIQIENESMQNAKYLHDILLIPTGFDLEIQEYNDNLPIKKSILILINPNLSEIKKEGYILDISPDYIQIVAIDQAGLFYGIQTLRQLLPAEIENNIKLEDFVWNVPCLQIVDYPRFSWRGFMLDEGRHFQGKKIVKKLLDLMALHKLNIFHWHLTEDQGWRIEIKKYPLLTKIGSKRKADQIINSSKKFFKRTVVSEPHSGFYTQDEIKEIVKYASRYFIKIIPEIDMPGHIMSALVAYPEFSCTGGPFEPRIKYGLIKEVLCIGNEMIFNFLQDILKEVLDLFPSEIIHIGGDEVIKKRWKKCSKCQKRIKDEDLKNEHDLQTYFTKRIVKFLALNNRTTMGWNQILHEDLDSSVLAQYWMGKKKDILSQLQSGRKIVMSNFFHTYLDYNYILSPLRKFYNFNPIPNKLEQQFHKNILGIEALLWTEWVRNEERLDWQIFPRLCASAEVAWTINKKRNYSRFKQNLIFFLSRLKILKVNYAKMDEIEPKGIKRLIKFPNVIGKV